MKMIERGQAGEQACGEPLRTESREHADPETADECQGEACERADRRGAERRDHQQGQLNGTERQEGREQDPRCGGERDSDHPRHPARRRRTRAREVQQVRAIDHGAHRDPPPRAPEERGEACRDDHGERERHDLRDLDVGAGQPHVAGAEEDRDGADHHSAVDQVHHRLDHQQQSHGAGHPQDQTRTLQTARDQLQSQSHQGTGHQDGDGRRTRPRPVIEDVQRVEHVRSHGRERPMGEVEHARGLVRQHQPQAGKRVHGPRGEANDDERQHVR
jgi:hypothetical protein